MLDPQPPLGERLVGPWLLEGQLRTVWLLRRHEDATWGACTPGSPDPARAGSPPVRDTGWHRPWAYHRCGRHTPPVSSAKNCRVCFSSIDSRDHPVWRDHREEAKSGPPWEHRLTRNAGAMVPLLLPWAPTGLAAIAAWCGRGTTPRGPPWSPACTLPHVRDGLRGRYRARLCPCGRPSRGRPAHRA